MAHLPHVLILNIDFPPDTSDTARVVLDLAEALAQNHRVTVLAGRPFYNPTEHHPYYLLRSEDRGTLRVERVGSTSFNRQKMRGRLANYLSYMTLALPRALLIKADVIIAMTSPPLVGLVGAIVARFWRRPFIYNIRDLHPDMAVAAGLVRAGFLVSLWDRLNRWVLGRAQTIIVLGEDMRERVIEKGIVPERVEVVRNGAPPPEVPTHHTGVIDLVRGEFAFVVLHAGNLGFAGAWDIMLEAARILQEHPIGFVFVGDGASLPRLKREAKALPNVRFLPFQPPDDIPNVLAAPDLHVVTVKRGLEGLVVPGKLYPILWSGRPVLALAPEQSDVARIVREYGCGLVADPEDPQALASAVSWAYTHPEELKRMGKRALEAAQHFDRRVLVQRFIDIVDSVAAN